MNTEELQTLEIPLSKLLAWNDNVRTTGLEEGIGELAHSIAAVGFSPSLVLKKEPRGSASPPQIDDCPARMGDNVRPSEP